MNKRSNRETFRFPFDIDTRYFLGSALIFFILSIKPINDFILGKLTVNKLKARIEKDITAKINSFRQLKSDTALLYQVFMNAPGVVEPESIRNLPYDVFCFQDHRLIYWNHIQTILPIDSFPNDKPSTFHDENGYYIAMQQSIGDPGSGRNIVALFKIKNDHGFENRYFTRNFLVGDRENDFNIGLSVRNEKDAVPIVLEGKTQYYIVPTDDFLRVNDKDGWRLFLSALPFIFFGVSIHTYFKVEIKKGRIQWNFGLLLLSAITVRWATYQFGFPNDFNEYGLFFPQFCATDKINKSLGDLFINMCLAFWVLLFFIINVMGKVYDLASNKYRYPISSLIFLLCILCTIYLGEQVNAIVMDSVIHFDTTRFNQLDLFSFIGLLTFMVIFVNIVYLTIIAHYYLNEVFSAVYIKYIFLAIAFLIWQFIYPWKDPEIAYYTIFLCVMGLFLLQDFNYLKIKFDFNSYKLLIWMLIISATGALFLTFIIEKKELLDRQNYAERMLQENLVDLDAELESAAAGLPKDTSLMKFAIQENSDPAHMSAYLMAHYFNLLENSYRVTVQRFAKIDTGQASSGKVNTWVKFSDGMYRMQIPIVKADSSVATLKIELQRRQNAINEYADLLEARQVNDYWADDLYSSAVYDDTVLSSHRGAYIFPFSIASGYVRFDKDNTSLSIKEGVSEWWLQNPERKKKVVVVKQENSAYLFTTLFAYIFFIYFVTVSLYILGNIIARSNLNYKRFVNLLGLNLRLRIQLSIMMVEIASFIIIGYFTSVYLMQKVNEKMGSDLHNYSYKIQHDYKRMIRENVPLSPDAVKFTIADSMHTGIMKTISDRLSINLNLYSIEEGKLVYSSLPELFADKILSDRIDMGVFHQLKNGSLSNITRKESIGLFNFSSSYFVIYDQFGKASGIVQLPFFFTNAEIRTESTAIITTLINIYIFVFLVSAIIAFFLTKSVTRPFTYIVKQFTKINLTRTNEPLKWFDSDEIGLLIKEYNRMLRKLENSTVLLAKTEREMAWREMAKQVAHEIKNPLTPMKLSLQMLERAIKNNATNVNETAIKVTKTLVEQIDNLSLIATNFSNFAKLPASQKEVFPLNEFLYSVTGMYHDDNHNEFLFMIPDYEILLFADKSQIMRVFTNIIQNAIQSIPEDRKGNIALTVSKIRNNHVRVSISDNGEGISAEKAKNLFQPYFTTKTSGTGLGLAMCKDIIEDSGGKISFESIMSEGTVFHIDLPVHNPD